MIQRFMMRYLQRHGWIVFWLDAQQRYCSGYRPAYLRNHSQDPGVCWLKEYFSDSLVKAKGPAK